MASNFETEIAKENAFEISEHGETIQYTPKTTGVQLSIQAIVDRSSQRLVPVGDGQKMVKMLTIWLLESDVATPTPGEDAATIDSESFALDDQGETIAGMHELFLRSTNQIEYHQDGHSRERE
jgi:hypothetical protein